ncbi:hypothetical protein ZOSMA_77G00850 [Zostera marina]|uniref:RING-type domain-containing protein n=1 Tax=Zostera marina TaxID=29655 RepID=A0A0K9NP83_ZOSMR|nr:hypothetical protein ZOSMA_77G00850 [Zostera marina]
MDKEPQSNKVILSGGKRKVSEADLNLNQVGFYHQDPILSTLLSMRKHINSMTPEVEVQSINPLIDVRNIDSDVVIMSNLRGYNKAQPTHRNFISKKAGPSVNLPKRRLTITRLNHPSSPIRNLLHASENTGSMENIYTLTPEQNPFRSTFSETIVKDEVANLIPPGLSDVPWLCKGFASQFLMNSPIRDMLGLESIKRQCIENEEEKKREEEKKKKREEEEAKKKAPVFVCPVCQEQFVHATSTICGHIFCEDCIKKSIRIQKKCPTCRRKLTSRKNQIHRVYLPLAEES